MTLLPELLRVAGSYEPIITAVIIILVIMFLPAASSVRQDRRLLAALPLGCARKSAALSAASRARLRPTVDRGGGGMSVILETKALTKRFGGLVAVNGLDLEV